MEPGWTITENEYDPKLGKAYEGLFTLGSGLLHVRGSLEEHLYDAPQNLEFQRLPTNVTSEKFIEQKAKWGTYHPGMRGRHPHLNRGIVNLPYFLELIPCAVLVQGAGDFIASEAPYTLEKLDMERSQILEYERSLDLKRAVLSRRIVWKTIEGACLEVNFMRFISAAHPCLCVQRMEVSLCQPDGSAEMLEVGLVIQAGIDADVRTSGYDMFSSLNFEPDGDTGFLCNVTTNEGDTAEIRTWLSLDGIIAASKANSGWTYRVGERKGSLECRLILTPNQPIVVEKRTCVHTSFDADWESYPASSVDRLQRTCSLENLLAAHTRIWEQRWEKSDVIIEDADPESSVISSQLAIRASIFHLLRSHPDDERVAIDPKAYAGDAYRGAYFWDTEMYLLPFYLYTDPERARSLLAYRINSLPGAIKNARLTGYRGARYAWEADIDGTETCANWQYRDHEVHVTADVVYAMAHYAAASGDTGYLEDSCTQVILETARYWQDRVDWRKGDPFPSLLGVMGPDEYAPITSNNSYTNRLAAFNLALAAELGAPAGASKGEIFEFCRIAEGLPILRSEDGSLVLQCEEFEKLAEPAFDRFWLDRTRPFASQVAQEWLYRSKCLKQADVLMLMMLFPNEFSDEDVKNAWDTYLPYTTHDSSLSAGAHAIVACRLGNDEDAWRFWEMSSLNDLDFKQQSGHDGAAEGVHIAGAGVNWQVLIFGFAGLSTAINTDVLSLRPRLPKKWSRLAFSLTWKQQRVHIEITHECVNITNLSNQDLEVNVLSMTQTISPGERTVFQT